MYPARAVAICRRLPRSSRLLSRSLIPHPIYLDLTHPTTSASLVPPALHLRLPLSHPKPQKRHASSLPTFSKFTSFFQRSPVVELSQPREGLDFTSRRTLRDSYRLLPQSASPTSDDLLRALQLLQNSTFSQDRKTFDNLVKSYLAAHPPSPDLLSTLLTHLLATPRPSTALHLAQGNFSHPELAEYSLPPTTSIWLDPTLPSTLPTLHRLLQSLSASSHLPTALSALHSSPFSTLSEGERDGLYTPLLRGLAGRRDATPTKPEIESILSAMQEQEIPSTEEIEIILLGLYSSLSLTSSAYRIAGMLRARAEREGLGREGWEGLIAFDVARGGYEGGLRTWRRMVFLHPGWEGSGVGVLARALVRGLMKGGRKVGLVVPAVLGEAVEQEDPGKGLLPAQGVSVDQVKQAISTLQTDTAPLTPEIWSIFITGILGGQEGRDGRVDTAVGIWEAWRGVEKGREESWDGGREGEEEGDGDAQRREKMGIRVGAGLIKALARRGGEGDYTIARGIFEDFGPQIEDLLSLPEDEVTDTAALAKERRGLEEMYAGLLEGCGKSDEPGAGVPGVIKWIEEMKDRAVGVRREGVMRLITTLMGHAKDHYEAFQAYSYTRSLDPTALDGKDYSHLITRFAKLSFPHPGTPFAPPKLFFEFVKDMRRGGFQPDAWVYTTLIAQYTKFLRRELRGGVLEEEERRRIGDALGRVHTVLKMDSFIQVDVALLNALMNAYNQVGAWGECFEVWEELMLRSEWEEDLKVFGPSLNIVLDACGYSGSVGKARKIWRWANRGGVVEVSQANREAWVECLCRLGRVGEAVESLVKGELGEREGVEALVGIVGRFSRGDRELEGMARKGVEGRWPGMWDRVREWRGKGE